MVVEGIGTPQSNSKWASILYLCLLKDKPFMLSFGYVEFMQLFFDHFSVEIKCSLEDPNYEFNPIDIYMQSADLFPSPM